MNKPITYSAGFVIYNSKDQLLLVENYGCTWSVPKGHLDNKEDVLTAAYRELWEETNLTESDIFRMSPKYSYVRDSSAGPPEEKHITLFTGLLKDINHKCDSDDPSITNYKWVYGNEAEKLLTPKDYKAVSKLIDLSGG